MKVLELYAGIGGVAAAVAGHAEIVAAIDHDEAANALYVAWFGHPAHRWNLTSVPTSRLTSPQADLWWMSPPCQPFTVRGRSRDVDDPRCESFLAILGHLEAARPPRVALENVPGFAGSRAHARLRSTLHRSGYRVHELELCPSSLGVPNRRRRFYLLAEHEEHPPTPGLGAPPVGGPARALGAYLDSDPAPTLRLEPSLTGRFGSALSLVDADDPDAIAECFTSAYGRSPVHAGSYLRDAKGIRRFSPTEILRFLGFPDRCQLPTTMTERTAYKRVGNSLSVVAVRALLTPWLRAAAAEGCPARTTPP